LRRFMKRPDCHPVLSTRHPPNLRNRRSIHDVELLGGVPDRQVLPPHVFAGVTNDMAIAQDEIFGPTAPIIQVKGR
jgi:aldehyde dehydrogenase (NAD+)